MFMYFVLFFTNTQFSSSSPLILRAFACVVFTFIFNIILSSIRTSPTLFLLLVFLTKILYVVLLIARMLAKVILTDTLWKLQIMKLVL